MELKRTKEQTINALKSMANGFIPSADCEEDAVNYSVSEIAKDTLALIAEYEKKIADYNTLENMTVLVCKTTMTREEMLDLMHEGEYIDLRK